MSDLYGLWLSWGTSCPAQEWAALVMEVCPRTEEDKAEDRGPDKESRDGVNAGV